MPNFVIEPLGPATAEALSGRSEIFLDSAAEGDEIWITDKASGLVTRFQIQSVRHCVVATGILGMPDRAGNRFPIEERHTVLTLGVFDVDDA